MTRLAEEKNLKNNEGTIKKIKDINEFIKSTPEYKLARELGKSNE